jgi:hypothetical protein
VLAQFSHQVRARDDNTCCACQKKDGHLEADHLIEKRRNDAELLSTYNLVSRHDIKNGITLCKDCHYLRGEGALFFNMDYTIETDESKLSATGRKKYLDHLRGLVGKSLKLPSNTNLVDLFPSHALAYRVPMDKPKSSKSTKK